MIDALLSLAVGVWLLLLLVDLVPRSNGRMDVWHVVKLALVVLALILYFKLRMHTPLTTRF